MCHRWIYRRAKLVTAGQKTPGAGLNVTGDPNKTATVRKTEERGFSVVPNREYRRRGRARLAAMTGSPAARAPACGDPASALSTPHEPLPHVHEKAAKVQ